MSAKIAIATIKGKPYYLLVRKLNEKNIPFESIVPGEEIPSTVMMVITTPQEKPLIHHPNFLIFKEQSNLEKMVNDIIRILAKKKVTTKLVLVLILEKPLGLRF